MKLIIIAQHERKIKAYLRKLTVQNSHRNKYFSWNDHTPIECLEEKGFKRIVYPRHDDSYKDQFLEKYIHFIGALGKSLNSRLWWATEISSKNSSTSMLPFLLEEFLMTMKIIQDEDCNCLVIYKPSRAIIDSLQKNFLNDSVAFKTLNSSMAEFLDFKMVLIKRCLSLVYSAWKAYLRKNIAQKKLKHCLPQHLDRSFYVIKTFTYKHSFIGPNSCKDIFFGTLPHFLRDKKHLILYTHVLEDYRFCIDKFSKNTAQVILPVEFFLSSFDIVSALFQVLFLRLEVKESISFLGHEVSGIVNFELARRANRISLNHFLHYGSMKNFLKKIAVDTFLLTYENRAWERMCIMAIKEYSKNTAILGYQHAVVPKGFANFFTSRFEEECAFLPDRILTTGECPKNIMKRYGHFQDGILNATCGLRFEYLYNVPESFRTKGGHILIALDGAKEAYRMIYYVLKELYPYSHTRIKIRAHPEVPWGYFKSKLPPFLVNRTSIEISQKTSLKDDIDFADIVIYGKSTVALEALWMGKPVIHFCEESILDCDPLFECNDLKWIVREGESLHETIEAIYSLEDKDFLDQKKKSRIYLNHFFHPVTEENLRKFIR